MNKQELYKAIIGDNKRFKKHLSKRFIDINKLTHKPNHENLIEDSLHSLDIVCKSHFRTQKYYLSKLLEKEK